MIALPVYKDLLASVDPRETQVAPVLRETKVYVDRRGILEFRVPRDSGDQKASKGIGAPKEILAAPVLPALRVQSVQSAPRVRREFVEILAHRAIPDV